MVEWVRILADWLADPTNGVNALLAGVPRYTGHAQPAAVTIYNEYDHGPAARGFISEDSTIGANALLVYVHDVSAVDAVVATEEADATPTIMIAAPLRKSDTADALRTTAYTLRAVDRSLVRLNESMPYGLVHGVELIEPVSRRWTGPFMPVEGALAHMGIAYTGRFRDNLPRG